MIGIILIGFGISMLIVTLLLDNVFWGRDFNGRKWREDYVTPFVLYGVGVIVLCVGLLVSI